MYSKNIFKKYVLNIFFTESSHAVWHSINMLLRKKCYYNFYFLKDKSDLDDCEKCYFMLFQWAVF